jgi:ribosomal protein S18 acetylase RimI-like enzyme
MYLKPRADAQGVMHVVFTLQAYISHRWGRELQIRIGKEQELFQGLARLHLDTFSTDPVLLLSEDSNAAGILLSSQQEKQLVTALKDIDFSVIAGTLQIMQTMPEARLPQLTSQLQQLQESSAQAIAGQGHSSYLKLVCLGVRPEFQCKGKGTALLATAMAEAQRQGTMLLADAADMAAVQMLERHGFKALDCSGMLFTQLAWAPV